MPTVDILPNKLFQAIPIEGHSVNHGRAWTTKNGARAAAKQLAGQLTTNQKLIGLEFRYPYCGTIKILGQYTVSHHKALRDKLTRRMREAGLIALWIAEITARNEIDYHLVIRHMPERWTKSQTCRLLKDKLRKGIDTPLNIQFAPIRRVHNWINYVCKTEIAGYERRSPRQSDNPDDIPDERYLQDVYGHKRVLFIPKSGLTKLGTIGKFWEKTREDINEDYRVEMKKRNTVETIIEPAAKRLADLTGYDLGHMKRELIKEWREATDHTEIRKINSQLADDWYREQPEYQEELQATEDFEARYDDPLDRPSKPTTTRTATATQASSEPAPKIKPKRWDRMVKHKSFPAFDPAKCDSYTGDTA